MDLNSPGAVGIAAESRLRAAGAIAFMSYASFQDRPVDNGDLEATGVTHFDEGWTRCRQRLSDAISREATERAHDSRDPVDRALLQAGAWLLRKVDAGKLREYFYEGSRSWEFVGGRWQRLEVDLAHAGSRAARDPTLCLESLGALTAVIDVAPGGLIGGAATTLVEAVADLRLVGPRFAAFLESGDAMARADGWFERAPVKLWVDETGLARRVSYAPLSPLGAQILWRGLEVTATSVDVQKPLGVDLR